MFETILLPPISVTKKFSFKESDVFKDKTLFNKKDVILTDYWNVSG
jgi:hypothetical protein